MQQSFSLYSIVPVFTQCADTVFLWTLAPSPLLSHFISSSYFIFSQCYIIMPPMTLHSFFRLLNWLTEPLYCVYTFINAQRKQNRTRKKQNKHTYIYEFWFLLYLLPHCSLGCYCSYLFLLITLTDYI